MMKNKFIAAAVVLALVVAAGAYKIYLQAENARVLTGTVEATQADITPRLGGYLRGRTVKEGDSVTAGQLVAQLDTRELEAKLAENEASFAKAHAQLADLEKGARPQELREAEANVQAAQAAYNQSHADRLRYEKLYEFGAIARQQVDLAIANDLVAENSLKAAQEQLDVLREGSRADEIEAQRREVERAAAAVANTKISLGDMTLHSPIGGVVLSKNYEVGEYVSAGMAIVTIADLNDCWVRVYVPSDTLGSIKFGQQCSVKIDAYPDKTFTGTIKEISSSAEYTPRQSITSRERANMVFAVKVALPNEEGIFKPGMVADVSLQ